MNFPASILHHVLLYMQHRCKESHCLLLFLFCYHHTRLNFCDACPICIRNIVVTRSLKEFLFFTGESTTVTKTELCPSESEEEEECGEVTDFSDEEETSGSHPVDSATLFEVRLPDLVCVISVCSLMV